MFFKRVMPPIDGNALNEDHDQTTQEQSDLGLHCLTKNFRKLQ